MALMQAPGGPSPGQTCALILIFTVLLQALCVAVTYVYFTNELKQMQDKYSKSGIACFLKDDDSSWDASDDESMINPCWHLKWQLRQFVRKIILRTYEETIPSIPEKQQNIPHLEREKGPQRVAAHITGTNRKSTFSVLSPDFSPCSLPASRGALTCCRLCSRRQPQSSPGAQTEARASAPSPARPGG